MYYYKRWFCINIKCICLLSEIKSTLKTTKKTSIYLDNIYSQNQFKVVKMAKQKRKTYYNKRKTKEICEKGRRNVNKSNNEQLLWKRCKQHMINCGIILNNLLRFNRWFLRKYPTSYLLSSYKFINFFLSKVIVFPHHLSTRSSCLRSHSVLLAMSLHMLCTMETPQNKMF